MADCLIIEHLIGFDQEQVHNLSYTCAYMASVTAQIRRVGTFMYCGSTVRASLASSMASCTLPPARRAVLRLAQSTALLVWCLSAVEYSSSASCHRCPGSDKSLCNIQLQLVTDVHHLSSQEGMLSQPAPSYSHAHQHAWKRPERNAESPRDFAEAAAASSGSDGSGTVICIRNHKARWSATVRSKHEGNTRSHWLAGEHNERFIGCLSGILLCRDCLPRRRLCAAHLKPCFEVLTNLPEAPLETAPACQRFHWKRERIWEVRTAQ